MELPKYSSATIIKIAWTSVYYISILEYIKLWVFKINILLYRVKTKYLPGIVQLFTRRITC